MLDMNQLMRIANEEQRKHLRELAELRRKEERLMEARKVQYAKDAPKFLGVDYSPADYHSMTDEQARESLMSDIHAQGREFRELHGRIDKVVKDAKRAGMLIVNYSGL